MRPTKNMLYASNPFALIDAGNALRAGKESFEAELGHMVNEVRSSGSSWGGDAYDAAYECVARERDAGAKLSDEVVDLADAMVDVGSELVAWRGALVGKVAGAEAVGCVVRDDWLVDHDDSAVAEAHQGVVNDALLSYCDAAVNAATRIADIANDVRDCGNSIGDPQGTGPGDGDQSVGKSSDVGPTDLLPGTPVPDTDGPVIRDPFGTTRIVPGQTFPAGFSDPDMTSPLSDQFGKKITIDPEKTPGAIGGYSGNTLTPNAMTGISGVGVPGFDAGKVGPSGVATRVPGSIDIDAVKGVQLRVVAAEPYAMSTVEYGGKPELAVHYRYEYEAQYVYTFVGNAVVHRTEWADISSGDVQALQKQGVPVPRLD